MGLGPVAALKEVLDKTPYTLSDFDIIETNEAFAAVVLAQNKALARWHHCITCAEKKTITGFDFERININGGAIALGHPLAASGTRLVLTCAKELALRDKNLGLVTLCIGGGQGKAAVVERV